jgi:hypothetical protein
VDAADAARCLGMTLRTQRGLPAAHTGIGAIDAR